MVNFDVKLNDTTPQIYVEIPLDEYLLDDKKVEGAKNTIKGVINLYGRGYETELFINGEMSSPRLLEDIVERYRSLYLLQLLDDVLQRIKPLKDSFVEEIIEKVEPLVERSKDILKHRKGYYEWYERKKITISIL